MGMKKPLIVLIALIVGVALSLRPETVEASGFGGGHCDQSCLEMGYGLLVTGAVVLAAVGTTVGVGLSVSIARGERPPWWWLVASVPVALVNTALGTAVLGLAPWREKVLLGLPLFATGLWDLTAFAWGLTLPRVAPTVVPTHAGLAPGIAVTFAL
jgi:hypothetical protein